MMGEHFHLAPLGVRIVCVQCKQQADACQDLFSKQLVVRCACAAAMGALGAPGDRSKRELMGQRRRRRR